MNNKNTNKKQHSNNLAIILTIIGLVVATTTGGAVYATQTINDNLHVTETDVSGYTELRIENPGQSNLELRAYGDSSSVWTGADIIASWNTDVDLGLVADSLTNVNAGTSDHVIWLSASSGNVGIGTTTPQAKLDVLGDVNIDNITLWNEPDDTLHLRAGSDDNGVGIQTNGAMRFSVDSDGDGVGGRIFYFGVEHASNWQEWMTINDGNVGIGTSNPNSKLEVTNGYIELDTSSGEPPSEDCDNVDEAGRMKVDSSSAKMYVCINNGSTYTWMTIEGDSFIKTAPVIISLVANDSDDLDDVYSTGDTITITFDSDTNEIGGIGIQSRVAVNDLFAFTEPLGQQYRGQWITPDTFVITIYNANNAGPPVIGATTVTPDGATPILSADGTSIPSTDTSPVLFGDFGIP